MSIPVSALSTTDMNMYSTSTDDQCSLTLLDKVTVCIFEITTEDDDQVD